MKADASSARIVKNSWKSATLQFATTIQGGLEGSKFCVLRAGSFALVETSPGT